MQRPWIAELRGIQTKKYDSHSLRYLLHAGVWWRLVSILWWRGTAKRLWIVGSCPCNHKKEKMIYMMVEDGFGHGCTSRALRGGLHAQLSVTLMYYGARKVAGQPPCCHETPNNCACITDQQMYLAHPWAAAERRTWEQWDRLKGKVSVSVY